MSRLPLLIAFLAATAAGGASAQIGHMKPGALTRPCSSCHGGHGVPGTALLRHAGDSACVRCHGPEAATAGGRARLGIGIGFEAVDIVSEQTKPSMHHGARCVDCHSVHGTEARPRGPDGQIGLSVRKPSPKRGFQTEVEMCLACHGSRGTYGGDPHDLAARIDPSNPSYHPILAPGSASDVPSLVPGLPRSVTIDCSDCHTSDEPSGPRGPHGSFVRSLLASGYNRIDGQEESESAYALCYSCHLRAVVLDADAFPGHRAHVVEERVPCATCHDSHGTTSARALIRFNEPTAITGVGRSSSGRLEFVSDGPGSGACYLTCHGVDHDPKLYGSVAGLLEALEPGSRVVSPAPRSAKGRVQR